MKAPIILRIFKGSQLAEVKQMSQDQIIFGSGTDAQVVLNDSSVSAIHCLIELRDSGYYLADLGSATGTYKNNKPVLDEPLSSGDQIGIGTFVVHFFVGVPKPKAPEPLAVPAASPSAKIPQPTASAKVEVPTAPAQPKPAAPKLPDLAKSEVKVASSKSTSERKVKNKNFHTFAPSGHVKDLRDYLKPTRGPVVEFIVAWKDRVLATYHFKPGKIVSIGTSDTCDISIPAGFLSDKMVFADLTGATQIRLSATMTAEVMQQNKKVEYGTGSSIKLDQGELLAVNVNDGLLQIFVRHTPESLVPALAGSEFTANELTGVVVSVVLVALLALYMSVYSSTEGAEEKKEDQLHLAQVVFNKKPEEKKKDTPEKEVKPVEQKVPPPPQKVEITEKKKDAKGDPNKPEVMKDRPQARAAEVRPMPNNKNKPKKFTSTKQGGSVKIAEKEGANAQSAKDVTKTGLLAAFGSGGNRSQLDKAYSGSGELLGMADKATGTSGQSTNRAGDDLGSKFKDSGAGGKGTATQGIAGVGTKGRSSGQSAYGNIGAGGKGSVAIDAGGSGAEFVGTVDKAAVRRVVISILNQIQNCYNRGLRTNSDLEGKVTIHWEVYEQGVVKTSRVKDAPSELKDVAECVALRIRDQRFPEPPIGSYYEVDYPFLMGKQK